MPEMLAAFTLITGVLWEKMNEGEVFYGKDCALCLKLFLFMFYFNLFLLPFLLVVF